MIRLMVQTLRFRGGILNKMNSFDELRYERLIRAARAEESLRVVGIIEMYKGILGETSGEKTAKKILEHVIKTVLHNPWKPRLSKEDDVLKRKTKIK